MMNLRTFAMTALISATGFAWAEDRPVDPPAGVNPDEIAQTLPLPQTPAAVQGLLYARPFTLKQGYEFEWRAERPVVKAGWLLVLDVAQALVFPRQTAEPVLYVGNTTAERVNLGHESGRIIVIVPSDLDDSGEVALDLRKAMMWFGAPGLPEQVDAARVDAEQKSATAARIAPFSADVIIAARAKDNDTLNADDRQSLRHAAAELIRAHSPQEALLAETILGEDVSAPVHPAGEK